MWNPLYGQQFVRYRPIFKMTACEHETDLGKIARNCLYTFFLQQGVEIDFIFVLWAVFIRINNFHID